MKKTGAFCQPLLSSGSLIRTTMIVLMLPILSSCYYYKVRTYDAPVESKRVSKLVRAKKFFILHHDTGVWHLKEGSVNFDGKDVQGVKEPLGPKHWYYKYADRKHLNQFTPAKRLRHLEQEQVVPDEPVYEVHLYVSGFAGKEGDEVVVPLESIQKIEVFDLARGATVSSHLIPTVAGGLTVATLIGFGIAAFMTSIF